MDGTNEGIVVRNVDRVIIAVIDGEWEGTTDSIDEGITLDKVDRTKDGELDGSNNGKEEGFFVRNLDRVTVAVIDREWERTTNGINEWITLDKVDGTKDGELDRSNDNEEEGDDGISDRLLDGTMDANSDGLTDRSTNRHNISRDFIPLIVGGICLSNLLPDKLISLTFLDFH